jgi:hypothetical protein
MEREEREHIDRVLASTIRLRYELDMLWNSGLLSEEQRDESQRHLELMQNIILVNE